jgi:inward rectifier potassium channel
MERAEPLVNDQPPPERSDRPDTERSDQPDTERRDDAEPGQMQLIRVRPLSGSQAAGSRRGRRFGKDAVLALGSYTLTKKGVSRYDWADPYRLAVELTWPRFLAVLFTIYVAVTALFAILYSIVPGAVANARPHALSDHFFFSLETLATVGYGYMYPATMYGHLVASAEIVTGLTFTAILTGLTFVRFSKPRAKFMFAKNPIITTHNGKPTLMLRIGNGRPSVMADARVKISILLSEVSTEGAQFRRTHELALVRNTIPVFPLTWTVMHEINQHSPLHGLTPETFRAADARLFVSFEARDPTLAMVVHDLCDYAPDAVLFGMRYVDVIGVDEDGNTCADMTKLSDLEPGPD